MNIAKNIFTYLGRSGDSIRRGAGSSNVTVVRGARLAVIDPGVWVGNAFGAVVGQMGGEGLHLEAISHVLLTHGHWDHMNAAGYLQCRCGACLAVSAEDRAAVEDREQFFREFDQSDHKAFQSELVPLPRSLIKLILWYSFGKQPVMTVDRVVRDGDRIDVGRILEVIGVPGHTPGHVGYLVEDCGALVTGDLFDFENSIGMDVTNFRSDVSVAMKSIEKVISLGPEVAIPGHGQPIVGRKNVTERLEHALATVHHYLGLTEQLLSTKAMSLTAVTKALFPSIPLSLRSMTMLMVLNMLRFLEQHDRVERTQVAKIWSWTKK